MSLYKKLGIGLSLTTLLLAVWALAPKPVNAASITDSSYVPSSVAEIKNATFEFQDRSTIIGHFTRTLDSQAIDIEFTDSNPADNTYRYKVDKGLQPAWCDEKDNGGINFGKKGTGSGSIALSNPRSITQVKGYMDIDYSPSGVGGDCKNIGDNKKDNPLTYVTKAGALYTYLQWDSDKLVAGPGSVDNSDQQLGQSGTNDKIFQTGGCGLFAVLTDNHHGKLVQTEKNSFAGLPGVDAKQFVPILSKGQCKTISTTFSSVDGISIGSNWSKTFAISGTRGSSAPPTSTGSGGTGDEDKCAQSGEGWGLTWLACPVFSFGSGLADGLIKTFEKQASFTMSQLTNNKTNPGNNHLHDAWASIRNIASAFLVIIMLVAVISQALSFGPFDAYTIRKMLPRIVVAIILMQFSWILVGTIVNIVNTIGNGLQDLLYAPFNNSGQLNKLGALFGNAGFGTTATQTFNWLAIIGTLALAVAALPTLIVGIFAAIVALAVGLAALIFRKILIMMLVLFAPIAFLLWILPGTGTQKYFKLWSDNLTKALMMYPLIVLLISGGRVFAWVAGGDGGIVAFLTVMIGFFGPLFILPKTYKWGGSMMSSAGNAIANNGLVKGFQQKGSEGLRGTGERWQGKRANMYNPEAGVFSRGLRRVQSGHAIPFSKRSQRLAIGAGDKWSAERQDEASAYAGRVYNQALENGYQARNRDGSLKFNENGAPDMLSGVAAAKQSLVDLSHHSDERIATGAIKQLVDTNSWPEIEDAVDANGRRVFEDNPHWNNALSRSPEHYSKVLRSRADLAPHILDMQKTKGWSDAERMEHTISQQLSNEDFISQSQGFWKETEKLSSQPGGEIVRNALRTRLHAIQGTGSAGQQILGHLAGGEMQGMVDRTLGGGRIEPGATVTDYLSQRGRSAAGGRTTTSTETTSPGGVITIEHGHGSTPPHADTETEAVIHDRTFGGGGTPPSSPPAPPPGTTIPPGGTTP